MQYHTGLLPSDPVELKEFCNTLERDQQGVYFGDVASHLYGSGEGKLITPYKSAQKFQADIFGDEAQKTGSCTSHAARNAVDIARSVEIDIKGEPEEWVARTSCEAIYAGRGHGGQGMAVDRAAKIVHNHGFLSRIKYPFADLSQYNDMLGANLGNKGIPSSWLEEMKKHNMRYMTLAKKPEDVRDALNNGFGVFRGSFNYAISSKPDGNGVNRVTGGSWGHAQAIIGVCEDTSIFPHRVIIECNSWGKWCATVNTPFGQLPVGAYLLYYDEWVKRLFNQGNVWIVGDSNGYPAKDLPNYGTSDWL